MKRALLLICAIPLFATPLFARWYCPALNKTFVFPDTESNVASLEAKYATMISDAALEDLYYTAIWDFREPTNAEMLKNRRVTPTLLSRGFIGGMHSKLARLLNTDYHATHRDKGSTNTVLALSFDTHIWETGFECLDARYCTPYEYLPGLFGTAPFDGCPAYLKLYELMPYYLDWREQYPTPHPQLSYMQFESWSGANMMTKSLILKHFGWPMGIANYGWTKPYVFYNAPYTAMLRDPIRIVNGFPLDMLNLTLYCQAPTPFELGEHKRTYVSKTTYLANLKRLDDGSCKVTFHFVDFSTTISNMTSKSTPIVYGQKVQGETYAGGFGEVANIRVPTEKKQIGEPFSVDVFLPSKDKTLTCTAVPIGFVMKPEEINIPVHLHFYETVKTYSIGYNRNYKPCGFPAARSHRDKCDAYTFYKLVSEGVDFYGGEVSVNRKGLLSFNFAATNDPYYVSATHNMPRLETIVTDLSNYLSQHPQVDVQYNPSPESETHKPWNASDERTCLLFTKNDSGIENVVGFYYPDSGRVFEDEGAIWEGDGIDFTISAQPYTEEVQGDPFWSGGYDEWRLPFEISFDLIGVWEPKGWMDI